MDLTTLERVRALMGYPPELTADQDVVLAQLITGVSADVEMAMERRIELKARTKLFSPDRWQIVFPLDAWPNVTVASVIEDCIDRTFTTADGELTANAARLEAINYTVNDELGLLYVDGWALTPGRRTLQVVYTGGLADSTDNLILGYADIAAAVDAQVVFYFRRRDHIGQASASLGGISQSFSGLDRFEFQPILADVVARYRRPSLG